MVNVTTTVQTPGQRAKANMERLRKLHQRPGLRVEPNSSHPRGHKEADLRRLLKHPKAGGFRSEGSVEWPDDVFTRNRLRDGDITLAEQKEEKPKGAAHQHHASSGRGA